MTSFYSSLSDSKREKTATAVVNTTSDEKARYEKDEAMCPHDFTASTALIDNSDLAFEQSLLGNNQEDEEGTWTQVRKRSALRGIPHSSSSASSSPFSTSPPHRALSPSLVDSSLSPIVNSSSTVILSRSSKRASLKRSRSPTPPDAPTQIVNEYNDEHSEQTKAAESDLADIYHSDDPDMSSKSDVVETNVTNLSTKDDEDGVNLTPSLLQSKKMLPSPIRKGVQSSSQKGLIQTEQTNVGHMRSLYKSIRQKENAFASSSLNGSSRTSRGLFDRRRNFDDIDDEDDDKHLTSLFAPLNSAATSSSSSINSNSSPSSSFDELTPISSQSSSLAGLSSSIEEASLACTRVLSKAHFKEMATKIYGQFNLGFIIAGVGHDLFILDQHACDEKFRFESLRRDTEIHVQRLLVPRDIDLTAAEELVILGNLDVFARNGFHFTISGGGNAEEDDPIMQSTEKRKIRVSAFPFSKQTQFGDEDVRELASILADRGGGVGDGGGQREEASAFDNGGKCNHDDSCGHIHSEIIEEDVPADSSRAIKLPRLNAMFASRACRSAVMIGTALEHYMMRKIVHQMAALEDPWCCPHGRPTLRHLVDLSSLKAVAKKLSIPGRETRLM